MVRQTVGFRYGLAIAWVFLALVLMLALDPMLDLSQASFLLFYGAVTLSALYGGRGPGVVATLLSALTANVFFLTLNGAGVLRLVLFILQGVLISFLVGSLRLAQEQTRRGLNQLKVTETEIKELNQTLQRSVNELQTLFSVIPVGIAIADDPDCQSMRLNPALAKLLNIPGDPNGGEGQVVTQEKLPFRVYQDGRELAEAEWPQRYAARQGIAINGLELQVVRPDSTVLNLFGHAAPLFDEWGQPRGSVGAFVDITERKRFETALHKLVECSQATGADFFETLVRVLTELFQVRYALVAVVLPEHRSRVRTLAFWADGKLASPLEYDLSNTPCEQVMQQQTCCYSRNVAKLFPKDPILAEMGIESYIGVPLRAMDGEVLGVMVVLHDQPLDERHNLKALLEVFAGKTAAELQRERAIAELRQSEERYRYLAESIPQLIWTATPEGTLLDVNQRWLDFTGLTPTQAQQGGWARVVHPDDVLALTERWNAAQQAEAQYQAEGRMRRVDGVYRWHLHQAIPIRDDLGRVVKWFGSATDIDDKKRLEQERDRFLEQEQTARAAAEQANRIKDEFLAVLSHELRSPLNPILGWIKLLRTGTLDAAKTAYALETIERNAKLQTQLIEDLLDVSRILRGKLSLTMIAVDLSLVIESALETVRLAAEAKAIAITLQIDPTSGSVVGDAARLQQVVWNLLSNAVKFTPNGGRINICLESKGDDVQIQVSDTGKGISPEFLPHIFEYFRQADSTTTRKFGGLGLGLAIVRQLVELHGGTIQADSAGEGQGSCFTVRLPIHPSAKSQLKPTDYSPPSVDTTKLPLQGIHVLLVDDETDTRDLGAFVLAEAGAQVTVAASAQEALEQFSQIHPDVVVSDIGMPEMDGYGLIKKIRAMPDNQGGNVPAIALTAYAGETNQKQAIAAGFQRHLSKPMETLELVKVIQSILLSSNG